MPPAAPVTWALALPVPDPSEFLSVVCRHGHPAGRRGARERCVRGWTSLLRSASRYRPAVAAESLKTGCAAPRISRKGARGAQSSSQNQLRTEHLGVAAIVFLVLAAVAPLTGIVVVASLAIALGNGGGAPASFFIVAVILLFFAIGYAQMSSRWSTPAASTRSSSGPRANRRPRRRTHRDAGLQLLRRRQIGTRGFFMQVIIAQMTGLDISWIVWACCRSSCAS